MKISALNRDILRLMLPAVAANITVPLLGLSDTALTGHLGDEVYIAAIAAGGMMLNVIYWIFGFLRMATTGLTAEAYGAHDADAQRCVFSRSALLAIIAGVSAILMRQPLCSLLVSLIGAGEHVAALASQYFYICILGAPAMLLTMSINGWFIGNQNTVRPMAVALSVNIINIALSITGVVVFRLGFEGVAYGTLCATWAGVVIAVAMVLRKHSVAVLWCGWSELLSGGALRKFFNVSGELFLRSFCIMGVTLALTAYGAQLGDLTLAVNAVMMQFFMFFSYFVDGLAFSGEALCGKNAGARNTGAVMDVVRAINIWGGCMAVTATVVYATIQRQAVALLTDVEAVRAGVEQISYFVWLLPVVSVAAFLYDGFFIGLTATRRMLVVTATATAIFFAIITICPKSNLTLWWAFLSYLFTRGMGLALQLKSVVKRLD